MRDQDKTKEVLQKELAELQQTYNELRIKEERYRLLAENARDVIWTMKLDGTITYISPAVELLRGFTVEEAMHQPLDKILTPDSQIIVIGYLQRLNSAFDSGFSLESFRGENEYYCKDGSTIWAEVIVYPIYGSDTKFLTLFGVSRDITERKRFEEQLLDQANKLKELNATKDKLFSIIAHDLRSPFINIIGLSELLIGDEKEGHASHSEKYVGLINSSAKNTLVLLDNLLNWAKSQTSQLSFNPKKTLLSSLIKEEINTSNPRLLLKNISLNIIEAEEVEVYADENMVKIILRNLISNAIKFTKPEGKINVIVIPGTKQVEISISDYGVGMNEEKIKTLFNIFSNSTSLGTENEKGSGLGLILCKEFVEKNGGKIWVESKVGKGSNFKFTLPLNE